MNAGTVVVFLIASGVAGVQIARLGGSRVAQMGKTVQMLFFVLWFAAVLLGLAVMLQQGPDIAGVATAPPSHTLHGVAGKLVLAAAWTVLFFLTPLIVQRGRSTQRSDLAALQVGLSIAVLFLVMATEFTGYLGGPPTDERTFARFRMLHTIAMPAVTMVCVAAWIITGRRLWTDEHEPVESKLLDRSDTLRRLTPWASALAVLTVAHIVCVAVFWRAVFSGGDDVSANYFVWALIPLYPLEIGIAYFIQKRLKQIGHISSGAWQVIAGSLLLNPLLIGWWIAASVLFSFIGARQASKGSV